MCPSEGCVCLGEGCVCPATRECSGVRILRVGVVRSGRLYLAGDGVPVRVCRGEGFSGGVGGSSDGGQGVPGDVVGVTVVYPRVPASPV